VIQASEHSHARSYILSLLLLDCDFQFTVTHTDGTLVPIENGEFSQDDAALLQKLLRHLETASKRTVVRRRRSNTSLWQRLFGRQRLPKAVYLRISPTNYGQKNGPDFSPMSQRILGPRVSGVVVCRNDGSG
jgi:hypothetical protein